MVGPLNSVQAELTQFLADGATARLDNANSNLEGLLSHLASLPSPSPSEEVALARAEIKELRRAAQQSRSETDEHLSQLTAKIRESGESLQALAEQRETEVAALRADVANAQHAAMERLTELTNGIEQQKGRLDQAIEAYQAQFSSSQEARNVEFTALREQAQADHRAELSKLEAKATAVLTTTEDRTRVKLEEVQALYDQAAKVTSAIGITGMAEGFRLDADKQKKAADEMRKGAVGSLVVGAVAATVALLGSRTGHGHFLVSEFLSRMAVSAILLSIAGYFIVQSAQHRQRERYSRKVSLELASIDPYLALPPDETKYEVKRDLAMEWFGKPLDPTVDASDARPVSIPVAEVISLLMKLGAK